MAKFFISEETKKKQQELSKVNKTFVICDNWHEFATNHHKKVDFMVLPHQTKNGMWGVVYHWKDSKIVSYFSASEDVSQERKEIEQLSKLYVSLDINSNPDDYNQSPKTNTGDSVGFSEAYANYVVEKLVEYYFILHCSSDAVKALEEWNKVTDKSNIENYQKGEYQNLKNDNDLTGLKDKISQWENATWTKDPETVKNWYKPLQDYWHANFSKDYSEGYGIAENGLEKIKKKLNQLEGDNQHLSNEIKELKDKIRTLLGLEETDELPTDWNQLLQKNPHRSFPFHISPMSITQQELQTIADNFSKERLIVIIPQRGSFHIPIHLTVGKRGDSKFCGKNEGSAAYTGWVSPYDKHYPSLAYYPRSKLVDGFSSIFALTEIE